MLSRRSRGRGNWQRLGNRQRQWRKRLFTEQLEARCVLSAAGIAAADAAIPAVPGEFLIGFRPGLANSEIEAIQDQNGLQELRSYGVGDGGVIGATQLVSLPAEESLVSDYVAQLRRDPRVAFVEPNYLVEVQLLPNDPLFEQLWGLNNEGQTGGTSDSDLDAPEAWNLSVGSTDVVVGIVDTGVDYTHPDLYLNIWLNQGEIPQIDGQFPADVDGDGLVTFYDLNDPANEDLTADLNSNGYIDGGDLLLDSRWSDGEDGPDPGSLVDDLIGWDFNENDNDPSDDHGHGTHVSGTIGSTGDDTTGVVGINWRTQIMPLKFLGRNGAGATSDAISAIDYATLQRATLTNNSWGGGGFSAGLQAAIAAAGNANMLFVAAAGNEGVNNDFVPTYPASYNLANVISVAASDHNDALASFSNFGNGAVDIAAPGVNVVSTTPNFSYSTFNGTSMATPHVAGVAALAWSVQPEATYQEVRAALLEGGDRVAALGNLVATGARVNAFQTLQRINPHGGTIRFDEEAYRFPDAAEISVFDSDPDVDPNVRDTVTVNVTSSSETTAEEVVLTETGPSTQVFVGTISLVGGSSPNGDGRLQVAHGDEITAAYIDTNPGSGPGLITDSAAIDVVDPIISGVISAPSARRAIVQWTTDEPSSSEVRFGVDPNNLDQVVVVDGLSRSHAVGLFGLADETTYFFEVSSTDRAGNRTQDSGHNFVTLAAPPILFVDDDQGASLDSFFVNALDANGYVYAVWDVARETRAPTGLELSDHATVIWNTGANYEAETAGITPTEEAALRGFLDNGGRLFLAGQDILFNGVSSTFLTDYLHVADFLEDAPLQRVIGSEDDPIGDGLNLPIVLPPPYEADFADRIIPDESAAGALYATGSDGAPPDVAVRYPAEGDGHFKTVFFTFPFEAISPVADDPNNQAIVMQRVLDWLGNDPPGRPGFVVTPESGLETTERGGTATFTVAMKTPPVADVSLTIVSLDPTEGLVSVGQMDPAEQLTLTFSTSDWDIPQRVTVTGIDDSTPDGDRNYVVVTEPAISTDPAYAGLDADNVSVTNLDDRPFAQQGIVENVGNGGWTEVLLDHDYGSMVVVTTPNYTADSPAGVVRIRNAESDRFEVRVDSTNGASISGVSVHYLVMEEGVYSRAEHGVNAEARKFVSTVTDGADSWVGEPRDYGNRYEQPVVLGQVQTYNDPDWSVFWSSGSVGEDPPAAEALTVGKHVGEDPNRSRADETIGYIVIEEGRGSLGGFNYSAALGADSIFGVGNGVPSSYPISGLTSAATAIATQAGMDGWNGGWAVLLGVNPVSTDSLSLAIDEDQLDGEREHTTEQVAYIVFEREPNLPPEIDLDANNSSGAVGSGYNAVLFHSRDITVAVDEDAELNDPTSDQLTRLVARITNLQDGEDERLLVDVTGTQIAAEYDSETGELVLSGTDSIGNYERVLRSVLYENVATDRDDTLRIVTFEAFDGSLWSEIATTRITFAPPNRPPTAHPGGPYVIARNSTLLLNGSLSIDPDAGPLPLRYEWDVNFTGEFEADTAGRVTTISWGQLVQEGIEQGNTYTVALRVFDGEHESIETTRLTVEPNQPPVVQTGGPYTLQPGWTLFLNSLGSFDPEGGASILKIEWDIDYDGEFETDFTGASVALSWSRLQQLGIKPGDKFTVAIKASDEFDSSIATTQVTVLGNLPPTAGTGGPYFTQPGWTVFLRSLGSFDPDFGPSPLSYEWDLNYDGEFEVDLTGSLVTASWHLLVQHGIEPGKSHPLALRVSDGASSTIGRTTITVTGSTAAGILAGELDAVPVATPFGPRGAFGESKVALTGSENVANSSAADLEASLGFDELAHPLPYGVDRSNRTVEDRLFTSTDEEWRDTLYDDWFWME